jgi:hypothetical protein
MKNIREILRRLIKYLILVLIVAFACFTLIKQNKLSNYEIMLISLTAGMVYNILDLVSPSIKLNIDKNCGI